MADQNVDAAARAAIRAQTQTFQYSKESSPTSLIQNNGFKGLNMQLPLVVGPMTKPLDS
jgi:hypothetical protein